MNVTFWRKMEGNPLLSIFHSIHSSRCACKPKCPRNRRKNILPLMICSLLCLNIIFFRFLHLHFFVRARTMKLYRGSSTADLCKLFLLLTVFYFSVHAKKLRQEFLGFICRKDFWWIFVDWEKRFFLKLVFLMVTMDENINTNCTINCGAYLQTR